MRKTITPQYIDDKEGKNGPFLSVKDTEGSRYSCFLPVLFEELRNSLNKPIDIEVMYKGEYANITGAGSMLPDKEHPVSSELSSEARYVPKANKYDLYNEKKSATIRQAQDRKDRAMQLAAASRDATLLLVNSYELKEWTDEDKRSKWLEWRDWFLSHNEPE